MLDYQFISVSDTELCKSFNSSNFLKNSSKQSGLLPFLFNILDQ